MQIIHDLGTTQPDSDVVLTIGTFDGVHLGHRHLLDHLVARARETRRISAVLTFHPHPRAFLHPELRPSYLSTPEERIAVFESLGVDVLVLLAFTRELAETPAEAFVRRLYHRLNMRELWVGADFSLGRQRSGNIARLTELSEEIGYELHVLNALHIGDETISSTRIRNLLLAGQVAEASRFLGRAYAVAGKVNPGAQRGRSLGFRTANVDIDPTRTLPANGVYAVWATVDGLRYAGVANIGNRPTFGSGGTLLEVHLLDYESDLYGKALIVEFVQRLRPELRFDSPNALVQQIRQDVVAARTVLGMTSMTG